MIIMYMYHFAWADQRRTTAMHSTGLIISEFLVVGLKFHYVMQLSVIIVDVLHQKTKSS